MKSTLFTCCLLLLSAIIQAQSFFKVDLNSSQDRLYLEVEQLDQEFLMVVSLRTGVGSNDIGLDRGKLGGQKVVKFQKYGNKILLKHINLDYRAKSNNPNEVDAVEEAFATSILHSFEIVNTKGKTYTINLAPFLLEDHNGVVDALSNAGQGSYKLSTKLSAVDHDQILSFQDNNEFEALLTFTGKPEGRYIRSVTPSPKNVTVTQHISFVKLPDDNYVARVFHPRSGYFQVSYADYATPIDQPLEKKYITRHRLVKKNPNAAMSDPIEPIIYYIDRGCPEPIKSALMDGARWWSEAFEAAGFSNAFFIKEMPEDAHPLDVHYNMIQWVHRSTRGWSYGASVTDPRTGEIIKGHVSLGSLRVRQDYMLAQGILSPFKDGVEDTSPMIDLALARLRQLAAHEVGHTLGLAHNFAASMDNRASVMDYPHPVITLDKNIDLSDAYAVGIGEWDKRAIMYGYSTPINEQSEEGLLKDILDKTSELLLNYLTDKDARPNSSSHPYAHLWDNGIDPIVELDRLLELRADALARFGSTTIPDDTPYSELEKLLVPVYYMHRYQVEAAAKLIGGMYYAYTVKGTDPVLSNVPLAYEDQLDVLDNLINTLSSPYIVLPDHIKKIIPPHAAGYFDTRESLPSKVGFGLDEVALAESQASHLFSFLLHPERINRIYQDRQWSDTNYFSYIFDEMAKLSYSKGDSFLKEAIIMILADQYLYLMNESTLSTSAKADILQWMNNFNSSSSEIDQLLKFKVEVFRLAPYEFKGKRNVTKMPPGSPIGMTCSHGHH